MRLWIIAFCLSLIAAATCLTFVLGPKVSAQGPWIPIVAKQKDLNFEPRAKGLEVQVREMRGTYLRSSNGSVMRTLFPVENGRQRGAGESFFSDASTGNVYKLFHEARRAVLIGKNNIPLLPHGSHNYPAGDIVGHEMVNGVDCVGVKVKGTPGIEGVSWDSLRHDLTIKLDFRSPGNGGHMVKEIYDIQETEPDPSLFGIPMGYTVQSMQNIEPPRN